MSHIKTPQKITNPSPFKKKGINSSFDENMIDKAVILKKVHKATKYLDKAFN